MQVSDKCPSCGQAVAIGEWPYCPHGYTHRGLDPNTHPQDRVVVFESAAEGGKVQYPGRNDEPVPQRLAERGYVRRELNVRDLAAFEKRHNVMNERRHFDRNGRYE